MLFDRSLQKLFLSYKPVLQKTAELHKFVDVLENSSNVSKFGLRQRLRACLHGGGGLQVGQVTQVGGVTRLSI